MCIRSELALKLSLFPRTQLFCIERKNLIRALSIHPSSRVIRIRIRLIEFLEKSAWWTGICIYSVLLLYSHRFSFSFYTRGRYYTYSIRIHNLQTFKQLLINIKKRLLHNILLRSFQANHNMKASPLSNRSSRITYFQIQLYGFNKQLYHNMSEAQHKSQGIVGISLMVQVRTM